MVGYFRRKWIYRNAKTNNGGMDPLLMVFDHFNFDLNHWFNTKYLKYLSRFGVYFLSWYTNKKSICDEIDFVYLDTYNLNIKAQSEFTYVFKDEDGYLYVLNHHFLLDCIYECTQNNFSAIFIIKLFTFINDANFMQKLFFNLNITTNKETISYKTLDVDAYLEQQTKEDLALKEQRKSWRKNTVTDIKKEPESIAVFNTSIQEQEANFWLVYFANGQKKSQSGIEYIYYKWNIKFSSWLFKYFFSFVIMNLCEMLNSVYNQTTIDILYKKHFHKRKLLN